MEQSTQERIHAYNEDLLELDLKEYLSLLWHRKWLIIGLVILAVIVSYFISKQMAPIYQTSTLIMIKEDSGTRDLFNEQFASFAGKANKAATYAQILKSRRITEKVISQLKLCNEDTSQLISPGRLQQEISINLGGETNLITISVNYSDPFIARDIANKLVEVFQQENQDMNRTDLRSASKFITTQIASVQKNLSRLEENTLNYKQENGIILPEEYGKKLLDKLTRVQTIRAEAKLDIEQNRLSLAEYEKYFRGEDKEIISSKTISNNPIVSQNKNKLANLEIELAGLLEIYTDKHPKVIEAQQQMDEVKALLARTVDEIISSRTETINPLYQTFRQRIINLQVAIITAQSRLESSQMQIADLIKELSGLPEKELNLLRLQRETQVAENIYVMLMERNEEIKISEAMQSSDVFVVDPAIARTNPVKPRVKLNIVIAALLALIVAVMIILLLEYLDTTVKNEEDVERLTGLPVLGVVPDIYGKSRSSSYYGGGYY